MPKSLLYIPGLAVPGAGAVAASRQQFQAKVASLFRLEGLFSETPDDYMVEMVETLCGKGAVPVDCRRSLHWVHLSGLAPRPAPDEAPVPAPRTGSTSKAMHLLGRRADDVLAREAGVKPVAVRTALAGAPTVVCTAAEYLAQPKPSPATPLADARPVTLATLVAGDTLYIAGHSNANGGSLTYKYAAPGHIKKRHGVAGCAAEKHSVKRHVDPVTLASLLVDEGLPRGVQFDIAVVACFSGGLEDDSLQKVQSFAQRLAGSLSARGYPCRVYGAKGLTSSDLVGERREVHVTGGGTQRADGAFAIDASSRTALKDEAPMTFYQRFFRAFS